MQIRLQLAILMCCMLAACSSRQPPITRDVLVGNYIYKSEDPEGRPSDHDWDRLIIRADGTYDLVEGGPTKPRSEKTGVWNFYPGDPPIVDLDHAGYPIEIKRNEVRLLIDLDVGIWYAK